MLIFLSLKYSSDDDGGGGGDGFDDEGDDEELGVLLQRINSWLGKLAFS